VGCTVFGEYYRSRHTGRILTWHATYGTAELSGTFDRSKHTLSVSTAAMIVLLQFNDLQPGEMLSLGQLQESCGLPEAELARALLSLACGKARVLTKQPMSRHVLADDVFGVNTAFTSKLKKVKIQ